MDLLLHFYTEIAGLFAKIGDFFQEESSLPPGLSLNSRAEREIIIIDGQHSHST